MSAMTLPVVTCVTCRHAIADGEVTAGSVRLCQHCEAVPWYHQACVGAANCPTCAQPLTVADEWSPRQASPDHHAWAEEDRPAQQVPASWETIPDQAPATVGAWQTALTTFLQNPPPAVEWEYLGYQNGGHELRWYGESSGVFGQGYVDVHFHIHFTGRTYDGRPEWTYGSAWITGVHGMSVNIQATAALHATVLPVVTQHWTSVWAYEQAIREAADRGAWR